VNRDDDGSFIVFYDFATRRTETITRVPNIAVPSLSVSRDGRWFLYARIESRTSDITLVEGFR